MTAARKKAWACENCGSTTASTKDERYCPTCTAEACDVCEEWGMGNDHSWHCTYCGFYATGDDPRSDTEATLHEQCIGRREEREQWAAEREERSKAMAERQRQIWGTCAMVASGGCGDPTAAAWGDIGSCKQEDGRRLCHAHDESENREQRAAEAEAQRVYDALPKEQWCDQCETVVDPGDEDPEPWYHCDTCDEEFNLDMSPSYNHQCPSCNKFASRSDTAHCGECQEPLEERPVGVAS